MQETTSREVIEQYLQYYRILAVSAYQHPTRSASVIDPAAFHAASQVAQFVFQVHSLDKLPTFSQLQQEVMTAADELWPALYLRAKHMSDTWWNYLRMIGYLQVVLSWHADCKDDYTHRDWRDCVDEARRQEELSDYTALVGRLPGLATVRAALARGSSNYV